MLCFRKSGVSLNWNPVRTFLFLTILSFTILCEFGFFSYKSSTAFVRANEDFKNPFLSSSSLEAVLRLPHDWETFLRNNELMPCASALFASGNTSELAVLHAKKASFATGKILESLDIFAMATCQQPAFLFPEANYSICETRKTKTMADYDACVAANIENIVNETIHNTTHTWSMCNTEFPYVESESLTRYKAPFFSSYGLHDACYEIPDYHYCNLRVLNLTTWVYGVCIPDVCTAADVKSGLQTLLHKQGKLDFGYGDTQNLDTEEEDTGATVTYRNFFTSICGDYSYPWTVGTTIMVIICFCILSLIAFGTAVEYIEQRGETLAKKEGRSYRKLDDFVPKVCKCFSLIKNGKSFLAPARGGAFDSFDGIRTFSMLWVVFGHTFVFSQQALGFSNMMDVIGFNNEGWVTTYPAQALTGAYFAVDTFFYMSAFLAMFIVMKKADELVVKKGKLYQYLIGIPFIYLQRFLRLTPTYFFILYMYLKVFPQMESGPFWNLLSTDLDFCNKYWWTNLLYINNVYPNDPTNPGCYAVTWYLANDFQFFLIVPFFGLLAVLAPKYLTGLISFVLLVVGAIVSIALAYVQSYDEHWSINIYDPNFMAGYFMKYYTKPWYRCPPYLMGMLFAIAWYYFYDPQTSPYAYLKNKKSGETLSLNPENEIIDELQVSLLHNSNTTTTSKGNEEMKYIDSSSFDSEPPVVTTKYRDFIQRNNVYKYSLLVFALFLFAITVLGAQGAYTNLPPDWSDETMSFYIALSKPAWTLGLCVLSALLFVGELPIISGILANRLTAVLGRLTFCAYLIHPSILFWHYYSEDNPDHFSDIWYALTFLSIVSAVFFLSALVHLAVELPVANLDKLFLGGPAKKPKGKDSSKQQTNHQVNISAQYNVHNSNQPNV